MAPRIQLFSLFKVAAASAIPFSISACFHETPIPPQSTPAIYGGSTDFKGFEDINLSTVALVSTKAPQRAKSDVQCTATLVGKQWAVTASHCISSSKPANQMVKNLRIGFTQPEHPHKRELRQVIEYKLPFGQQGQAFDKSFDLALLKFESTSDTLPFGYQPAPIVASPEFTQPRTKLVLAGYGADENHNIGMKRHVETHMHRFAGAGIIGSVFAYGATPGKGECAGDSGGPAFVEYAPGRYGVIGATHGPASRTLFPNLESESCNGSGQYAYLPPFAPWIKSLVPDAVIIGTPTSSYPADFQSERRVTPGDSFLKICESGRFYARDQFFALYLVFLSTGATNCKEADSKREQVTSFAYPAGTKPLFNFKGVRIDAAVVAQYLPHLTNLRCSKQNFHNLTALEALVAANGGDEWAKCY